MYPIQFNNHKQKNSQIIAEKQVDTLTEFLTQ